MTKSLQTFALSVIATLMLCSCAHQPVCERHQPLNDQPAPAPLLYSQCLREAIAWARYELPEISSQCSTILLDTQTKTAPSSGPASE